MEHRERGKGKQNDRTSVILHNIRCGIRCVLNAVEKWGGVKGGVRIGKTPKKLASICCP
jgi:hypothetical protein